MGFSPCYGKTYKKCSPEAVFSGERVFFATTRTSEARRILQPEPNATLLIEVLHIRTKIRLQIRTAVELCIRARL
jgi:hypothetical protein